MVPASGMGAGLLGAWRGGAARAMGAKEPGGRAIVPLYGNKKTFVAHLTKKKGEI